MLFLKLIFVGEYSSEENNSQQLIFGFDFGDVSGASKGQGATLGGAAGDISKNHIVLAGTSELEVKRYMKANT